VRVSGTFETPLPDTVTCTVAEPLKPAGTLIVTLPVAQFAPTHVPFAVMMGERERKRRNAHIQRPE
jgi:hypothetical protein